jgi:hypothetical protein
MSSRALLLVARVAGWLIVPLYIAGACAYYLLTISAGFWDGEAVVDNVADVMLSVGFGAFAVVGALLVVRRPTNAIGWILADVGLMARSSTPAATPPTSLPPGAGLTPSPSSARGSQTATGS